MNDWNVLEHATSEQTAKVREFTAVTALSKTADIESSSKSTFIKGSNILLLWNRLRPSLFFDIAIKHQSIPIAFHIGHNQCFLLQG